MKPILKYSGGKSKELKEIYKYIPDFKGRYIEPFIGGGALFFDLEKENSIINDINAKLITFYQNLKTNDFQIRKELKEIQQVYETNRKEFEEELERLKKENVDDIKVLKAKDKNDALYYHIRKMFNNEIALEYDFATIYYFINKTAYSGIIRYNSQGKYNVPYGRYKNFNTDLITDGHIKLLKQTEIYNKDYSEIFNMAKENDFIFLDPPYDCVFNDYGNNKKDDFSGFTEDMQIKLAQDFRNLSTPSLMIIGKTPLIEKLYKPFIFTEYSKSYSVNIKNRFKAETQHLVIKNY